MPNICGTCGQEAHADCDNCREWWSKNPPPQSLAENLRAYWREHLIHVAVAALAGWLLTTGWWPAGAAIVVSQNVRQVCGYWSKRDTINHDLAVVQAGLVVGVVAGVIL